MIETREIRVKTEGRTDIVDITREISEILKKFKIKSGLVNIFVPGSTASVTTIEYEPNLIKDVKRALDKIAPYGVEYEHHKTWGDDNGASHVRAALMKPGITIPFRNRELVLGTWQQVVLLDFDTRPRNRNVVVTVMGE